MMTCKNVAEFVLTSLLVSCYLEETMANAMTKERIILFTLK